MTPEEEKEIWAHSHRVFAKADETFREMERMMKKVPEGEHELKKPGLPWILRLFKRTK